MPTEVLRPDGTTFASSPITVTGAASAHAALSGNSDASFVTLSPATSAWGDLTTFSIPAGAVVRSTRVRVRARGASGGTAHAIRDSSSQNVFVASLTLSGVGSSFADFSGALAPTSATQAAVNALGWRLRSAGATYDAAELFVDVVYATQPTVTITSPTGDPTITDTNRPEILWNYAQGTDGGPQTRYEVKVFTQAQVAASGFDVDTTEPVYTSGVVQSGAPIHPIAEPLDNDEDYAVYVRAAQTINGVPHWSAWQAEDFSIDVDTADIFAVFGTGNNTTASIVVEAILDTPGEDWDAIEIQRSVDGGPWVPVRGADGVDAGFPQANFLVVDYETPNGASVHYRARATRLVSGVPITGAWVESPSPVSWSSDDLWVKVPTAPALNTTACLVERNFDRAVRHAAHRVLGRRNAVFVHDITNGRDGSLLLETGTDAEAEALSAAVEAGVVLVQAPPSFDVPDRYVGVMGITEVFRSRVDSNHIRDWSLSVVEVDAPADPTAGSGL